MANEISGLNTRGAIATAVGKFIQDEGSNRRTMILTDLDRGYREALRLYPWPQAIRFFSVSVSAGDSYFFAPKEVRQLIRSISSQPPYVMDEMVIDTMIDMTSGFIDISGLPFGFSHAGDSAISQVIPASTSVEILSDGTDVRTGFIKGILSGQTKSTAITLTSTSAVALGSWDEINELSLSTTSSTRTVTLRVAGGGATLATIASNETRSTVKRYRMWPLPSAAQSFVLVYRYSPPMILSEDHEYIIPINDYLMEYGIGQGLISRRQVEPGERRLQAARETLYRIWVETKGHRSEQYIPASPYLAWESAFYVPVLGVP